jgi:hypothetical protein
MKSAHVEAVKSIKNAVANKAFLHSKKLASAYANRMTRREKPECLFRKG